MMLRHRNAFSNRKCGVMYGLGLSGGDARVCVVANRGLEDARPEMAAAAVGHTLPM